MKKTVLVNLMIMIFCLLGAEGTLPSGGLIRPADAKSLIATDKGAVLIDVRTADEFAAGHIAGALLLPYDEITAMSAAKKAAPEPTVSKKPQRQQTTTHKQPSRKKSKKAKER